MSKIVFSKPMLRWNFGGVGFHNSEASMTPIMTEEFLNQRVLKSFNEISPTFTRIYAGYADWTREAMDDFVDYYDKTFRKANTTIYAVPGRMPMPTEDFDIEDYCERVATNLEYVVKERKCTKIRYYCVTNELSCGNTYAYLAGNLELFKKLHERLFAAFNRHNLDIGLLATDCSATEEFWQLEWAARNMDEVTDAYCSHLYVDARSPYDESFYDYFYNAFENPVRVAYKLQRRFILGEYGINAPHKWERSAVMGNDVCYAVDFPEAEGLYALTLAEATAAAINVGCFATVFWTLFDYPDPIIREDGDTEEEKKLYQVARFSGHGLTFRYNKNGCIRWDDEEKDYTARASLYTMGWFAKLFKKNTRVLKSDWDDKLLRACGVTDKDGKVSLVIINREKCAKTIDITLEHKTDAPLRRYDYEVENIPYNDFGDLQKVSGLVDASSGEFAIEVGPESVTFLTTDYVDREPSKIKNIVAETDLVSWSPCEDAEHVYYRVYKDGVQIASTVDEKIKSAGNGVYEVYSVDKFGNCLKK